MNLPGADQPSGGTVFIVYAHENDAHRDRVVEFSDFLRTECGVNAQLDRYFEGPRQAWNRWARAQIYRAAFVIVIASPTCKAAAEEGFPSDRNQGIVHELEILEELLQRDRQTWQRKILPVVLDYTKNDIPAFLHPYGKDRFAVPTLDPVAAADLLHALRGTVPYPAPPINAQAGASPSGWRGEADLDLVTDQLADRLLRQWRSELTHRWLDYPEPVQVRWQSGSDDIALSAQTIAAELPPHGLAADLDREVYQRLGDAGRLVLVGEPGVGKTTAMIQLLLSVLERRSSGGAPQRAVPVPVWLSLTSWNPESDSVLDWLSRTLIRDQSLADSPQAGRRLVERLLGSGRLALFLDGLDEMAPPARTRAMDRLGRETIGTGVVLSTRPQEYRQALRESRLYDTAVIELTPLNPQEAGRYLVSGQLIGQLPPWRRLEQHLTEHPDGVTARALNTPLTLSLARLAYRDGRDPMELTGFTSVGELRERLFDRFLVTAYPDALERSHAIHWLGWIAHQMNAERDLLWWRLPGWLPRRRLAACSALAFAAGNGVLLALVLAAVLWSGHGSRLPWLVALALFGFGLSLGCALITRWPAGREPAVITPHRPKVVDLRALGTALGAFPVGAMFANLGWAVVAGGPYCLIAGCSRIGRSLQYQVISLLAIAGFFGIVCAVPAALLLWAYIAWWTPVAGTPGRSISSLVRQDLRSAITVSVAGSVLLAALGGWLTWHLSAPVQVAAWTSCLAVTAGTAAGLFARPSYALAVANLMPDGEVGPARFVSTLEQAAQRGVLRQAGAAWQFRHAELQDYLARRYEDRHPAVAWEKTAETADLLAERTDALWRAELQQRRIDSTLVDLLPAYESLPIEHRLLVTGGPGTGKTTALIELLLSVLERRRALRPDQRGRTPVPVYLSIARWDPYQESLRVWAARMMIRDHPWLGSRKWGNVVVAHLLRTGLVSLFLDGLDELPAASAARAMERLDVESVRLRVVLATRTAPEQPLPGSRRLVDTTTVQLSGVPPVLPPRHTEHDQWLAAAYPDPEVRAHAAHWLGWIAHKMGPERDLLWWDVPSWSTGPRRTRLRAVLMIGSAAAIMALNEPTDLPAALIGAVAGGVVGALGWYFLPWPALQLTAPPAVPGPGGPACATPSCGYRHTRRGFLIFTVVGMLMISPFMGWLDHVDGSATSSALIAAIAQGPVMVVDAFAITNDMFLDLLFARRLVVFGGSRRIHYMTFLDEARQAGVLVEAGAVYRFRDATLQDHFRLTWEAAHDLGDWSSSLDRRTAASPAPRSS